MAGKKRHNRAIIIKSLLLFFIIGIFVGCTNKIESDKKSFLNCLEHYPENPKICVSGELKRHPFDTVQKWLKEYEANHLQKTENKEKESSPRTVENKQISQEVQRIPKNDPIPKQEFIKITEEILNVLDEVDSAFSSSETKTFEAKALLKKLDTVQKKYDRYVESWPKDNIQSQIVWAIRKAWMEFDMTLISGLYSQVHQEAKESAKKARELFGNYSTGNKTP